MISFKKFVEAIHQAIVSAGESVMDKNEGLLDKYFVEEPDQSNPATKILTPRIVTLDYPTLNDEGESVHTNIQVPLITLIPINNAKIEKATLSAEFALEVVNDELLISFPSQKMSEKATIGKLEIIISPQEPVDGLELIIDGYANALKRQLS